MTSGQKRKGPTRALEQVRDILFGGRVREILERIESVEGTLRDEIASLRGDLATQLEATADAQRKGDADLSGRLESASAKLSDVEEKSREALAAARASITAHVEDVAARLSVEVRELDARSVARGDLGNMLMELGRRLGADVEQESETS